MDIKIGDLTIDVRPIWLGGLMDPTWIRLIMVPRLNQVQQTFIVCSWHCGNPGRWDPRKVEKVHAKTHFVFAYFDKNHNFDPDESREMSKRMARAISPGDIRQVKPEIRARFPAHFVDVPYDRIAPDEAKYSFQIRATPRIAFFYCRPVGVALPSDYYILGITTGFGFTSWITGVCDGGDATLIRRNRDIVQVDAELGGTAKDLTDLLEETGGQDVPEPETEDEDDDHGWLDDLEESGELPG